MDAELTFCKLNLKDRKPLVIGSAYRPPNLDFEDSKKLVNDIYKVSIRNKNAIFWLGGDFNLPDINWPNFEIEGNQNAKNINTLFFGNVPRSRPKSNC